MRHTIHKVFFSWNYEKEERWLDEMSAKGLQLISVSLFKYVFEEGKNGEFLYRLEFLENWPSHPESVAYIRFLEETGVEHVASFFRWCYFRKKAADGPFEIYSDIDSKIKHYRRILFLFVILLPSNLINMVSGLINFSVRWNSSYSVILIVQGILAILLGVGIGTITKKIRRLKKEKSIRE